MEPQIISENTDPVTAVQSKNLFSDLKISEKIKTIKFAQVLQITTREINKLKNKIGNFTANNYSSFKKTPSSKNLLLPIIFIIVVVAILAAFLYFGKSSNGVMVVSDARPAPSVAKESRIVNKEIEFPIRDGKGKVVNTLKYNIETAELYDSFIVKGQRARAVQGRTFLILNLKLTNQYTQEIEIKTTDYVRLVNNKKELIAPDIHNDPVAVQAISTKYTRVGFAIDDDNKNLTLRIGEITGSKETLSINF
ncbi:MAG: hypothetical protein AAB531_00530 [Patescibacteria group bacterium]